jgi:hypothetical protein
MKRLVFTAFLLSACGGAPPKPPATLPAATLPTPPQPARYLVTVVSASIDGVKPDGTPWDGSAAPPPPAAQGPLVDFIALHPELGGAEYLLGEPADVPGVLASAKKSAAPDPIAFLQIGKTVYRTSMAPGQYQPTWGFPLVATIAPWDVIKLTVVDWDGPGQYDVIGTTILEAPTLTSGHLVQLPRFGNVERLQLVIEPAPDRTFNRRIAVAGRDGWVQTGVTLIAGDDVVIRATGEVCTKGDDRTRCAGPEGQPRTSESNIPGFEARGHGSLVGAVGDTRFFLGREAHFVAPASGPLLLSANDADTDNNSGEFEVEVEIR